MALNCRCFEVEALDLRACASVVSENDEDEILDTVIATARADALNCGYGRSLWRLAFLSPAQTDGHEEVAVNGSSVVSPLALVEHGDDDDDVRPLSFGSCPEKFLSLLLRSHSHAQALLIVIDAAGEAMSLADDGRPLCRQQA